MRSSRNRRLRLGLSRLPRDNAYALLRFSWVIDRPPWPMTVTALRTDLSNIQPLRALFLQENNFQIRYDACHERGWTDSYSLLIDDLLVAYGSIMGQKRNDRDTVFEYFVVRPFRRRSRDLFQRLLAASGARFIECQSNGLLLSSMLYEFSRSVSVNVVLFEDHVLTALRFQIPSFAPGVLTTRSSNTKLSR